MRLPSKLRYHESCHLDCTYTYSYTLCVYFTLFIQSNMFSSVYSHKTPTSHIHPPILWHTSSQYSFVRTRPSGRTLTTVKMPLTGDLQRCHSTQLLPQPSKTSLMLLVRKDTVWLWLVQTVYRTASLKHWSIKLSFNDSF